MSSPKLGPLESTATWVTMTVERTWASEARSASFVGVRQAVRHDTPGLWRFNGVRDAVFQLPADRRVRWTAWLDEAQAKPPHTFQPNGFVVTALQAA